MARAERMFRLQGRGGRGSPVASVPELPRRHFLSWDRPLLPQAVAFLAGDWTGARPLDLSSLLVVVPTRQSGRRLREALAGHAAARDSAVFPPRIATPEALVAAAAGDGAASRIESMVAWIDVLRAIDLAEFQEVFPVAPPTRSFSWALQLADRFTRVQTLLRENGLGMADVAARAGPDFIEAGRWAQLGALEQVHAARLRRAGLRPAHAPAEDDRGWREWLAGVGRVIVLATVDPMPSALTLLSRAAAQLPVDVVVFAPADEAARFDEWGRPITSAWSERVLELPDFERRVHVCADPAEQAARLVELARDYGLSGGRSGGALAIGIADPDVLPLVEGEATRAGVAVFNPEGRLRRTGALHHLLAALAGLARQPAFEAVETLARCPDFLAFLGAHRGPGFSAARFLAGLDELRRRHLPADLAAAQRHARDDVAGALAVVAELRETLVRGEFPHNAAAALGAIFGSRRLDLAHEDDAELHEAALAWTAASTDVAAAASRLGGMSGTEGWELARRVFGEGRRTEDKPAGALDLQGWLELLFEDAPHVAVAGFNDGLVPDAVSEDAFLPESLRARLGLKTNAARFARDACLLQAIAACRSPAGRIDLLLGKTSSTGDPLRPSRLLFRCPDAGLPSRVAFLFRNPEPAGSHLPWSRAWRLRPRVAPSPSQVAVTGLRRWLACPFRFYLQSVLRLRPVDAEKSEMDAFDFGTLCHAALEAMGREPALADCADAGALRDFLFAELTRQVHGRYGAELDLPLLMQFESARQRLGKLAELQAGERAAGWVIRAVEREFSVDVGGLLVNGKIDRIDVNAATGAVRVLDYKTSDAAVSPRAAHLRPARGGERLPDWAGVMLDEKPRAWVDLQLPLYRQALAAEWGEAITCGYINLPKAVGQTALALWDDYTPELHRAAMQCAEGVCAAIRGGRFWPPNENLREENDDFAALFHHGAADSVEWDAAATSAEPGGTLARE